MPLTEESKKVLKLAGEEADRLGHRHVGTEHFLVALIRVDGSLAAKLLQKRGLKPEAIREQLAMTPGSVSAKASTEPSREASATLDSFLAGLKWLSSEELISFFCEECGVHRCYW